jgi:hypothetical protein
MSEERRKILEMLSEGKITAQEADRLLDALEGTPTTAASTAVATAPRPAPKYLRIIVDANDREDGPVHINIRVPVMLLRAGVRLASFIPPKAQEKINDELRRNGVDMDVSQIRPENLNEIIDHLTDLSIDIDQKQEDVKVRIFAE